MVFYPDVCKFKLVGLSFFNVVLCRLLVRGLQVCGLVVTKFEVYWVKIVEMGFIRSVCV